MTQHDRNFLEVPTETRTRGRRKSGALSSRKSDVISLKSDATPRKSDVISLKSDATPRKSDVTPLKSDVTPRREGSARKHDVTPRRSLVPGMRNDVTPRRGDPRDGVGKDAKPEVEGWYGLVMSGLELHEAASLGDYDALEDYLTSGKYDVNLVDVDWENRTALHWASVKGYVECMRLLLEWGARGNARTHLGLTPAHLAAEAGKLTSLRALHAADVSIDRPDAYNATPLRVAEVHGSDDCLAFLMQAEEDIRKKTESGHDYTAKDPDYTFTRPEKPW